MEWNKESGEWAAPTFFGLVGSFLKLDSVLPTRESNTKTLDDCYFLSKLFQILPRIHDLNLVTVCFTAFHYRLRKGRKWVNVF